MAPVLRHCPCLRPESDDVRVLDYSHSNLDDVPNEVFGYERTLEELFLDANQIKDLPRPLFHCHGLRKLNLSDNEVQTLPSAIASLINLEHLDISKNGILEIPDSIKGCKCLIVIDASVNPLGKLSEGFTFLINLQELYLNDTFLEYLPANFGRLSHLRILELRENHLKLLPKSMARLIELSRLDIGQNDMSELPEVIGMLPRLVELWCDCNNLNSLPPFLGGLKKLAYLDASKNKIYEVADEIEGCISLCDLTLSSNRIKVLPDGIANLKKLTVLRVDENRIVSVPANIGNLCNLEELVLSSNNLKSLPPSLGLLRNLRTLISDDNLLEELPSEIGSCLKLTILSLRDNKLVQIPDELGHITALKVINLSGNLLQYLPFSIAKLPNLQALWLSENQNKPLIPLQSDTCRITGQKVLTCFMLPQVPLEEDVIEECRTEADIPESGKGRHIIKFAFDSEKDQPSKLVRAPTPYPKELKAHARHARNYALKKQGSKDSEGNEVVNEDTQIISRTSGLHPTGATPDIMILPNIPPHEPNAKVKEAAVIKPKSPLSSPKHERHYIQYTKDPSFQEGNEVKPHVFLEQNPLQISHQGSSDIGGEITAKVLGRRDSRGDGSSSENTSTSATGSPKLTPDSLLMDPHPFKMDTKEGNIFKKNIPPSKRDSWLMRQRLLKQGSGDSDRGYRSDHEVYMAEKDQYGGQCYHDGYASDWEAFLAKQNSGESVQGSPHYVRHQQEHPREELAYRGHTEGQEIMKGDMNYQWDPRYHYPPEAAVMADDEYQARMGQAYNGYWQTDPVSGQFYPVYDMSHSYPPTSDNPAYIYSRNQGAPELPPPLMPPQPYYEDCDGYKHIAPQFWTNQPPPQHPPNPPLPLNPPPPLQSHPVGTIPRRIGAASPRLKRSQCLSVQAPLHSTPQEYHLIPQGGQRIPTSPRPGCSPSPDQRVPQYSPQPYQKFSGHYQYDYPVTTQPVNATHFPLPPHPSYHPMYPTMPASPRMKPAAYHPVAVDDSALVSRPYPNVHNSNFYAGYAPGVPYHPGEMVQDAEYGGAGVPPGPLHYRSGSIPAQIQDLEGGDLVGGAQHFNRSVPSINIIPSTSPPQTSYMTNPEGWRGDPLSTASVTQTSEAPPNSSCHVKRARGSPTPSCNSEIHQNDKTAESQTKSPDSASVTGDSLSSNAANNPSVLNRNELSPTSSSPGSHVIISPKTQKASPPQQNGPGVSSTALGSNKDLKLSDNSQSGFRKPGCFQAVPVSIPSVHSVARKKESVEERPDFGRDAMNRNPESTSPKPIMRRSPVPPEPDAPPVPEHNPEAKCLSGYVGGIINSINKSLNDQTNEQDLDGRKDTKMSVHSVPDNSRNPESDIRRDPRSVHDAQYAPDIGTRDQNINPRKDHVRGLDTQHSLDSVGREQPFNPKGDPRKMQGVQNVNSKHTPRPGYPVPVRHSAEPSDRPPELPKKDKTAVTMRNIIQPIENQPNLVPHHVNRNTAQETQIKQLPDKMQKVPEGQRHSYQAPDSPKSLSRPAVNQQDRIAWENDKNKKYCSNANATSNQLPKQSQPMPPVSDSKPESGSKSSDKRFQKVLPPIDPKSFQLRPCTARKASEPEQSKDPSQPVSPAMPPKNPTNSAKPLNRSDSNVPPEIPPKRSSMCANTIDITPKSVTVVDATMRCMEGKNPETLNPRRLERTTSLSESENLPNVNNNPKVTQLEVDVVQSKDAQNEKNEQLQKGNMPDLISKMIPDEKNELIIMEQQGKVLRSVKSEEDELSKDNFTFSKESEKDNAPESPKSPKRQSWFFGTHKNSLVFPVVVSRNPELGFSIEGGIGSPRNPSKPYDNGIYIASVVNTGPASNLLRPGDKILQVDGKDFTQLDHNKAVALLQESGSTISLMISRQ